MAASLRPRRCDVLIIGGGVLGCAIAAKLSQTTAHVILTEADSQLAQGASRGNAGIASCFYGEPGTLESRLIASSVHRWERLCQELDVPYIRMGAILIALDDQQANQLTRIREMIAAHGARAELLTSAEALADEPMISPRVKGAIRLPEEGIINPVRLTYGYAELALQNGAEVLLCTRVVRADRGDGHVQAVDTTNQRILPRFVVNAAGLFADEVSAILGGEQLKMWPNKGQYLILNRDFGQRMRRIVFPTPQAGTRGIQVVPTTEGTVLLGPSATDTADRFNKSTDDQTLEVVFDSARRLVPSVSLEAVVTTKGALRPASDEPFRARRDATVPNLVHVGSRSAGVSASPSLAEHVTDLLREAGLDVGQKPDARTALPRASALAQRLQPGEGSWP